MRLSLSLKLLTTLAVLSTMSSQAMAQDMSRRDRHQAEREAKREQRQTFNQNAFDQRQAHQDFRETQRAQQQAFERNRQNANELARQQDRARELAQRNQEQLRRDARRDDRRDDRFDNRTVRWTNHDNRWDDRNRWHANRAIVSYNKAFRNWDAQREYLKENMRRLNQARALSALQQQQLNAEMQAAFLAYHNNNWNGGYNWDYYSEPQFLDYLQLNQPSLLDRILGYLGVGTGGLGTSSYLYSDNWLSERDQLARNMARIHQLALEGRITPYQEQQLLADLRSEFTLYKNYNWNGGYGWSQYSDPGFIDYLNSNRPSLLTTIRSYLR